MQPKFIGNNYQMVHVLKENKQYQTVICQDISNKNATHKFILNIYKDKELIQKFAPLLSKLNRDICHNFVELFVENSYLVSAFIYHEYTPLQNYLDSNDLTTKAQLKLCESLLLELLKNDNIPESLKYFTFNISNIYVDPNNKIRLNFALIPDDHKIDNLNQNIAHIMYIIFKDPNSISKDLKIFLAKLETNKYSLISSIYADYKRILDNIFAKLDIEQNNDLSTKVKKSLFEKFKSNTKISSHLIALRVITILLVVSVISVGSWYAYNNYFSTLINDTKPVLTESVIIDDTTEVNLSTENK